MRTKVPLKKSIKWPLFLWPLVFLGQWAQAQALPVLDLAIQKDFQIVLPDQNRIPFVQVFESRLLSVLASQNRFEIYRGHPLAGLKIRTRFEEVSFRAGVKGSSQFYGFKRGIDNPYSRIVQPELVDVFLNFTSPHVAPVGQYPWSSVSGLEVGSGVSVDIGIAKVSAQYEQYHSRLLATVDLQSMIDGRSQEFKIDVSGEGYFYDFAGAYQGIGGGLSWARRDTMDQVISASLQKLSQYVLTQIDDVPLSFLISGVDDQGQVWIEHSSGCPQKGERFGVWKKPELGLFELNFCGGNRFSFAPIATKVQPIFNGDEVFVAEKYINGPQKNLAVLSLESREISTKELNIDQKQIKWSSADLGGNLFIDWINSIYKKYADTLSLPYRYWRWNRYDREFLIDYGPARLLKNRPDTWVSVIDTGVDYSHPKLKGKVSRHGWDFVSDDERPFDDSYGGTEAASLIIQAVPDSKILPLKVMDAFGHATSARVLAAIDFCIKKGSKVAVLAWDLPLDLNLLTEINMRAEPAELKIFIANQDVYKAKALTHGLDQIEWVDSSKPLQSNVNVARPDWGLGPQWTTTQRGSLRAALAAGKYYVYWVGEQQKLGRL